MNINAIENQCKNFATSGAVGTQSSGSEITADSFQKVIANWEKQTKDAIDKERENDKKGNLQMSEKHWHNLMKKVDNAIDTLAEDNNKRKQEAKKELETKKLTQKNTIVANLQIQIANSIFIAGTSSDNQL